MSEHLDDLRYKLIQAKQEKIYWEDKLLEAQKRIEAIKLTLELLEKAFRAYLKSPLSLPS